MTFLIRLLLLVATFAAVAASSSYLVVEYVPPRPAPLVRHAVAETSPVDPANPCRRERAAVPAPPAPDSGAAEARYDRASNTITLTAGTSTLPDLARRLGNTAALQETAPGEWLLGANVVVNGGATLQVGMPEVRKLMLTSTATGFVTVKALGGALHVADVCVTSWDPAQGRADTDTADGRAFLLARDGAQMTIDRAEVRFLGYGEVESYGLSWRTEGTGGRISGSVVSHLYFGLYTYEVGGLVVQDNEFHDNTLYGIDPHTGSHNLVIERNVVHHNGKHGIVLAEDCVDNVVRENVVYNNGHHGIVLYLRSNRNLVEGNDVFANTAQGINVNESSAGIVRANRVYDNQESGIGVGQTSADTVVERNDVRGNGQDGVRLVSESTRSTLRDNVIGENVRYGVYVDTDGPFTMTGNRVYGSRIGVMLRSASARPSDENLYFDNAEGDVDGDVASR